MKLVTEWSVTEKNIKYNERKNDDNGQTQVYNVNKFRVEELRKNTPLFIPNTANTKTKHLIMPLIKILGFDFGLTFIFFVLTVNVAMLNIEMMVGIQIS